MGGRDVSSGMQQVDIGSLKWYVLYNHYVLLLAGFCLKLSDYPVKFL